MSDVIQRKSSSSQHHHYVSIIISSSSTDETKEDPPKPPTLPYNQYVDTTASLPTPESRKPLSRSITDARSHRLVLSPPRRTLISTRKNEAVVVQSNPYNACVVPVTSVTRHGDAGSTRRSPTSHETTPADGATIQC